MALSEHLPLNVGTRFILMGGLVRFAIGSANSQTGMPGSLQVCLCGSGNYSREAWARLASTLNTDGQVLAGR